MYEYILTGNRNSVSSEIRAAMQAQLSQYSGYAPIVTGHSLGGALCSIAAVSLVHDFQGLKAYSLGQFRTGNPAYAAYGEFIFPFLLALFRHHLPFPGPS